MIRTALTLACALVAIAGPAAAGEGAPAPAANPTVLMSPVALPVIVDGKLVNYVFVTLRLGLSGHVDAVKMRAKEPYFRDALVRAAHRTPFTRYDNYAAIDDAKMKATLIREANAVAGAGSIVAVQILREQPQHLDGLPKPKLPPQGR